MPRKYKTPNRAILFRALKEAGVEFDRHYRTYTAEELQTAYDTMVEAGVLDPLEEGWDDAPEDEPDERPAPQQTEPFQPGPLTSGSIFAQPQPRSSDGLDDLRAEINTLKALLLKTGGTEQVQVHQDALPAEPKPRPAGPDPTQHAGVTLNTHAGEPIRVDEQGRTWYQNEVPKPAYPKPRGRRVLRDMDPGVVEETIKVGDYIETFEIPGDPRNARPMETKVTLPSYQTGIFKEPGMPFRIHTYNGARGFDYDDVNAFFSHPDLVPSDIKRVYVSSDLCYDISTTIRAIENEYRERVLRKEALR